MRCGSHREGRRPWSRAVEAAGLAFLRPRGDTMEQLGGKRMARRIAVEAPAEDVELTLVDDGRLRGRSKG